MAYSFDNLHGYGLPPNFAGVGPDYLSSAAAARISTVEIEARRIAGESQRLLEIEPYANVQLERASASAQAIARLDFEAYDRLKRDIASAVDAVHLNVSSAKQAMRAMEGIDRRMDLNAIDRAGYLQNLTSAASNLTKPFPNFAALESFRGISEIGRRIEAVTQIGGVRSVPEQMARSFDLLTRFGGLAKASESMALHERLPSILRDPQYLSAFDQTRRFAESISVASIGKPIGLSHLSEFLDRAIPRFPSISDYDDFLGSAGLDTRIDLIEPDTDDEKYVELSFSALIETSGASEYETAAFQDIFAFERAIRAFLTRLFTDAFGADWPEKILPICNCGDLLGKYRKRGGDPLDHADWAHFVRLMSCEQVFVELFAVAFKEQSELIGSLELIRKIRKRPMHSHTIDHAVLRDLKARIRFIQKGFDRVRI